MLVQGYPMKRVSALWTNDKLRSECRFLGDCDPLIDKVFFHSASCTPGSAYVAIKGIHADGHAFIEEALANGATVVIHSEIPASAIPSGTLFIQHPAPRRVASLLTCALAGPLPSCIIGVTGTDGKSTTCDFLWQLLNRCGIPCGLLSSVSMDDGSEVRPSPYRQSTPEVPELYAFLGACHHNGIDTVILEATSHGLSKEGARLIDIRFSGAIYTTFSSEHLEFHGDIERYAEAKMNLARPVIPGGWIVLNAHFPRIRQVLLAKDASVSTLTYALDREDGALELFGSTVRESFTKRTVALTAGKTIDLPYGQACYAENAMGAILAAQRTSMLPWEVVLAHARDLQRVPGRFEILAAGDPCTIVIDFAHTADAFERLFAHVRTHRSAGRMIAVFGAAGERDKSKRGPMGTAAGRWCDSVYLTDEDPRNEHPGGILDDLELGIRLAGTLCKIHRIHDRQEAITRAIEEASKDDVVLLLGKGHERSIQYAAQKLAWNEREVAKAAMGLKGSNHG